MDYKELSLPSTVASILGKTEHEDYVNVGLNTKSKDLYKLLGLTNSPMLYSYLSGKTKSIEAERAVVILEKFNILIDLWDSPEALRDEATRSELSAQIAREPIKDIIEEIVIIEAITDMDKLKRALRKLIARYY